MNIRSYLLTALVIGSSVTAQAATIVNGDFSTGAELFTAWPGYVGGVNPVEITGWTGTGGHGINPVAPTNDPNNAPFGDGDISSPYAFLQGVSTLSQEVTGFSVGMPYVFSLDFSARNCCGDALPKASISINGVIAADSSALFGGTGAIPPTGPRPDNAWYHADIEFDAPSETITFLIATEPAAGGDSTFVVDNVAVSSPDGVVPEPSSVLLMALGLVLPMLRRRR